MPDITDFRELGARMRRLILLVPLVLVGGYALAAHGERRHDHRVVVAAAPKVRVTGIRQAAHEVQIAEAVARAAEAEALAVAAERMAVTAQARSSQAESAAVIAKASASVSVTLEGLLAKIEQEIERSAEAGEAIELRNLTVSAELLAQVIAELEGAFEIRADDGNRVVVSTGDGAQVELTISQ
jgi:hypothetical protein